MGGDSAEQSCGARSNGGPVTWEREFFFLAGFMLGCKLRACNGESDRLGVLLGEMDYGAEMHLLLQESGMLPAQRLARCAAGLLSSASSRASIEYTSSRALNSCK
jgi:hypothetical protein